MRLENQSMSISKGKIAFGDTTTPTFSTFPTRIQPPVPPQASVPQMVAPQNDKFAPVKTEPKFNKKDGLLLGGLLASVVLSATGLFLSIKKGKTNQVSEGFNSITNELRAGFEKTGQDNSAKIAGVVVEKLGKVVEDLNTAVNGLKINIAETIGKANEEITNRTIQALDGVQENVNRMVNVFQDAGLTVIGHKPPIKISNVSIWGDLHLNLPEGRKVPRQVLEDIQVKTADIIKGKHVNQIKPVKNPRVASISYEGFAGKTGGQSDVAIELPKGFKDAKVDVFNIAPGLHGKIGQDSYILKQVEGSADEFEYFNPMIKTLQERLGKPVEPIKITRIYAEDLETVYKGETRSFKMEAFHGRTPDDQEIVILNEPDVFNLGELKEGNIYTDEAKYPEKVRMAFFNKLTMQFLSVLEDKKIMLDGAVMRPVDRIVAHEAWQSGGLLGQMRFLSPIQKHFGEITPEKAEYFEQLADSSIVLGHNVNPGYQGWGNRSNVQELENVFEVLYGEFAKPIVEEASLISHIKTDSGEGLKDLQRVGFIGNNMNLSHLSVALKGKLVPVSENYSKELIDGIGKRLSGLIYEASKGGTVLGIRNGIDKAPLAPTLEKAVRINKYMNSSLPSTIKNEATGAVEHLTFDKQVQAYFDDAFKVMDNHDEAFKATKGAFIDYYKKFIEVTKNGSINNPVGFTMKEGERIPVLSTMEKVEFIGGTEFVNLDDVTAKTPIFSMIARMDDQKGFDTTAAAVKKVMEEMEDAAEIYGEKPVFILNASGKNDQLITDLENLKKELGEKGNRVIFQRGFLNENFLDWMNMSSDFTFMPSNFEPCGIGDAKSLACCTPVIASPVGGIPDKIKDMVNGIYIKNFETELSKDQKGLPYDKQEVMMHNATQMSKAILNALKKINHKPEEYINMRKEAGKCDFSWSNGPIQKYMKEMNIEVD